MEHFVAPGLGPLFKRYPKASRGIVVEHWVRGSKPPRGRHSSSGHAVLEAHSDPAPTLSSPAEEEAHSESGAGAGGGAMGRIILVSTNPLLEGTFSAPPTMERDLAPPYEGF
jgi:hypothetical protein